MQSSLYVALSAQVALQDRLDTLAQNVANGNTAGYRGNEVKFDSVISNLSREPVAFVTSSTPIVRLTGGALVKTGNALDVAVKGDGWLSVESPQGPVYTRDGRMQMNAAGGLISVNGAPVLDSGGTPIQLDASGGEPEDLRGWQHQPARQENRDPRLVQPPKRRQANPRTGRFHIQCSGSQRGRLQCERRRARLCGAVERESDHGDYPAGVRPARIRRR